MELLLPKNKIPVNKSFNKIQGTNEPTLTAPSSSSASVFIISRNFHACLRFRVWLKDVGVKLPAEHSFRMMGSSKASMDVSHGFAYFIEGPRSIVGGRFKHPLATIKQLLYSKSL